jgi:hypothetical protein
MFSWLSSNLKSTFTFSVCFIFIIDIYFPLFKYELNHLTIVR